MVFFDALLSVVATHAEWLIAASVATFLIGVVLVPAMVLRIPPDYFAHDRRQPLSRNTRHPLVTLVLTGAKNLLGAVLLVVGFVLLFLPGQGLLTLLVGLMIMDYPGKFSFERWLVRRPHVLQALNWLRERYGRAPLEPPDA
jgi:uncharacterized membrane protein